MTEVVERQLRNPCAMDSNSGFDHKYLCLALFMMIVHLDEVSLKMEIMFIYAKVRGISTL